MFIKHGVSLPLLDELAPDWQQQLYVPLSSSTFDRLPPPVQRSVTHTMLALQAVDMPRDVRTVVVSYVAGLPWKQPTTSVNK